MKNIQYQGYLNSVIDYDGYVERLTREGMKSGRPSHFISADNAIIAEYESLPWDGKILGVSSVRIRNVLFSGEPRTGDIEAFVRTLDAVLEQKEVQFGVVRLHTDNRTFVTAFTHSGWFVTDVLNIYTADAAAIAELVTNPGVPDGMVKEPAMDDVALFFEREADLFSNARMYNDMHVSRDTARTFYRQLYGSINKKKTSLKLGLYKDGQLIGIVLGELDSLLERETGFKLAYLWEIGICSEARGKGYAKILLKTFLERMSPNGLVVEAGTQVCNRAANRLYHSCGFRIVSRASTLHKWFV